METACDTDDCVEAGETFGANGSSDGGSDAESFNSAQDIPIVSEMDLLAAIDDATGSFYLFLNDQFDEAMQAVRPKAESSIYHAVCLGAMYSFKAVLTFDPSSISEALEVLRKAANTCNIRRRRYTLTHNAVTKWIFTPAYDEYTEEEIHAELCYAECLIMRAGLTFVHDTGIFSLVRSGFKVRKAHQLYRECEDILQYRTWPNSKLKDNFESGVNMGLGGFCLALSTVPKGILKVLEFVGFTGDRDLGLQRLSDGQKKSDSLRGPLCSLILIAYNLIVRFFLGNPSGNNILNYSEELLQPLLAASPEGIGLQFLVARLDHVRGNLHASISRLENTLRGRTANNKLHHLAAWEVTWCYISIGDFRNALQSANILYEESMWSKCTYSYLKACILLMCEDVSEDERKEAVDLMREAPRYLRQFIGRAVPVEKFFCNKAERFLKQDNFLLLPIYELMYVFNTFFKLKGCNDLLQPIIARIDVAISDLDNEQSKASPWYVDNYCLAIFLKGLYLNYMGNLQAAEKIFYEVIKMQDKINEDLHVVSFALMELGFMYQSEKNYERAVQCLTAARSSSIFVTEFRIHNAIEEIKRSGFYDGMMDKDVTNDLW